MHVLEDERLVERSAEMGGYLIARLRAVQALAPGLIRDVRGRGLWIGVDIDPAQASARELVERLAAAGVLSKETHETVIRFAPPLTITADLIDRAVDSFAQVVLAKARELARSAAPTSAAQLQAA
jgi:ornithine--oxo-acid transaminase